MKRTEANKDSARRENDSTPNTSNYLQYKNKFAVYVFFTKEELRDLCAAAAAEKINVAQYIRNEALFGIEEED